MIARMSWLLAALLFIADAPQQPATLPPWTEGTLDIHQICTGRGNAALFVFPDGTTMLVDAGAAGDGVKIADTDPRPNATRTAGGWIIRYIEHALAPRPAHLDYAVITHYHPDHMGQPTASSPPSKSGTYKLSGITEVGEAIPIDLIIDRGSFLAPVDDPLYKNYQAFLEVRKREALTVGRADQIVLRRAPGKYPTFEVRNVASCGTVWTGQGDRAEPTFPPLESLRPEDKPSENMCSIGLRIRYGRFDYFTGGDMPGVPDAGAPEWQSIETAVAKAIGPTDVHVVDHHGSIDPESAFFLRTLRSAVMILPSWSPTHPSQDALKRMMSARLYPGPHDIFATLLREPTKASIGPRAAQLKADHGHIVVRVAPGGASYQVFVLDEMAEDYRVLSVHGPYDSK